MSVWAVGEELHDLIMFDVVRNICIGKSAKWASDSSWEYLMAYLI